MASQVQQQQQQAQMVVRKNSSGTMIGSPAKEEGKGEELFRSALSAFQAKEEEIEKRKKMMKDKVVSQLGRVQEETKRLEQIRQELEALHDPIGKEAAVVRKRIDTVNKELRTLGLNCQKKEREYKEVLEDFNGRSKEKAQLVAKLVELVAESEKLRFKKLEELSKNL